MDEAVYALLGGVLFGLFYALLACGLNLTFGMQRVVNVAHGDVAMLGAFCAWEFYYSFHINPLYAIPAVVLPAGAGGYLLYRLLSGRLRRGDDAELLSLIVFFGISQALEAIETFGFGNTQRLLPEQVLASKPVHFLGQTYPGAWWIAAAISIPGLAAFLAYLYHTKLGRATRAISADRDEAAAVGINVEHVSATSFGLGQALAAVAGVLSIFMIGGANPSGGLNVTLTAFAIILLGGLSSPFGAIAGGVIYGVLAQFATQYAPSWSATVPYVVLLVIVVARPAGILGRSARHA